MRINSGISKSILAALFLVAYLNVFFTQVSCGFSHFYEDINFSQNHSEEREHHEHGKMLSHHHDESNHDHDGKEKSCCNDKTSAFFACQFNYQIVKTEIKPFISETSAIPFQLVHHFENLKKDEVIISCKSPPPKISDIRIFIHSFII